MFADADDEEALMLLPPVAELDPPPERELAAADAESSAFSACV